MENPHNGVETMKITRWLSALMVLATFTGGAWAEEKPRDVKGQVCHKEQQCHWDNFKKICTWVTVCR
jgi:hypothetical protein